MKGTNLITLYSTDIHDQHQRIHFRVDDKREAKTKNDDCQEMLKEIPAWGSESAFVTGDSQSSCVANLKWIKHRQRALLFGLESNRLASVEKGVRVSVQQPAVAEEGWVVWLNAFGQLKLFRTRLIDPLRPYAVYQSNPDYQF